jgi:hypothetical protein
MTTTEYKETLVKQYNETVTNLQRLEGAIAACNALLKEEAAKEETTEEETTEE